MRTVTPHWPNEDGTVTVYICLTDFECEIAAALGGNWIFADIEDAKEHLKCWKGCGIAAFKISDGWVVQEPIEGPFAETAGVA